MPMKALNFRLSWAFFYSETLVHRFGMSIG